MIEPKEVIIDEKVFILSKFPAVAGREIVVNYPISGLPKIGDYKRNEEIMLKLMAYVAVPHANGQPLKLSNQVMVDQHVKSWETLGKLEYAMLEYNCSFLQRGRISTFFDDLAQKLPAWTIKMLTDLSVRLSPKEKQP